ncbi:putative quorum-sensing-regulated virulence factor [Pleomorphovibrio marinus]|uniref:putative quorum-sensing-regulated virulence factor n=1 Tax=Pleomorphovibrio marinus TaxID=2164132 RepID=UPI000E0AF5E7|nr:DUF3820 family protein [Pleomorphovibrio marinus]
MTLTDNDPMPFGKHKGTPMANVPDHYLKWLHAEISLELMRGRKISQEQQSVLDYIQDYGIENLK